MSLPCASNPVRRLFLALWPEDEERRQIADLAASVAGQRRVSDANLHLTLVFLGATDADRLAAYQAALADLPVPMLNLCLDRYGYWPQSRILWLGCSQPAPELHDLVADLQRRLGDCGFIPERRVFQAHVTLARNFPGPVPLQPPLALVRWRTNQVALVESVWQRAGSAYQVVQRWPTISFKPSG